MKQRIFQPGPPVIESELNLAEVGRDLIAGIRWIIGLPVLLALAATVYVYLAQPRWEATSTIQIGRTGEVEAGKGTSPIETPAQAIERMKLRVFQDRVLERLRIPSDRKNPEELLFRKSLEFRAMPNTDFIEMKVEGYSAEEARRFAEATVEELREAHEKLSQPTIDYLHAQLAGVEQSLKSAIDERAKLVASIPLGLEVGPGNRFAENVLLGSALATRDEEIRKLQDRKLILEERLNPARTRPTTLIGIHVPEDPESPKKVLTVLLSLACGLIVGVLVALIRPRWRPTERNTSTA